MTVTVIQGSFEAMVKFLFDKFMEEIVLSAGAGSDEVGPDIPRTQYFVGSPEDLHLLVSSWASIAGKEQEKEYQQGLMTALLFSNLCAYYHPTLKKFLLEMDDDCFSTQYMRYNFHNGAGFAYLADVTDASASDTLLKSEPAGLSILCEKGAPEIWMLYCLQQASRPSSERTVTCVLPTMLLPSELDISDPGRIEQETGLKFTKFKNFQEINLLEIIKNPKLSEVISLLFDGNVCVESRLPLLKFNDPRRDDFMRVVNPELKYVEMCNYYHDMDALREALLAQDVSACEEVRLRAEQAAQALKDSPTFKENLASFHTAFGASLFSADFKEAVKTRQSLLQEFRHCCRTVSEGASTKSCISEDDVSRAMMILATHYIRWPEMIEEDGMREPLQALLGELKETLPWITALRSNDESRYRSPGVMRNTAVLRLEPEAGADPDNPSADPPTRGPGMRR